MAAPTQYLSGPGTIATSGEANGWLVRLGRFSPALLTVGVYGTFTSLVLAVRGRFPEGTTYYPLHGWTAAGSAAGDSVALAPSNSTATRWTFDVTGMEDVEIYAVSGTLTAVSVEAVTRPGSGQPVNNTTVGTTIAIASAGSINNADGNEIIKTPATVASAVNEFTVTNAAAGSAPSIAATGGDTNISATLTAKGTGVVQATSPVTDKRTQTAVTDTATLTIAQLLTKVIDGTPTAAASYTLPTAANLVAGIANCKVGDSFDFVINNKSAGANTITVLAGGATLDGTATVAQHVIRQFTIIVTNVTGSSEAYFCYGIG